VKEYARARSIQALWQKSEERVGESFA
jgi:hypothetical protein